MKKQTSVQFSVFAVLLLVLIIASIAVVKKRNASNIITFQADTSPGQAATLKDGSRLELKEASYGTQNCYSYDASTGWKRRVPTSVAFQPVGSLEAFTLVYNYYPLKAVSKFPNLDRPEIKKAVLSDDTGCALTMDNPVLVFPSLPQNGKIVYKESYVNFPRRGNTITAKIYLNDLKHPDAEYSFPNPFPASMRNFPVWKPERIPVSQTNGDLNVIAESFTSASYDELITKLKNKKSKLSPHAVGSPREYSKIQLNFHAIGKILTSYKINTAEISDPTGNKLLSSYFDQPASGKSATAVFCYFDNNLGGKESVVKLKLTCSRQETSPIPPRDVVQVTDLKPFCMATKVTASNIRIQKAVNGSVKHVDAAGVPIDVGVFQPGYFHITSTLSLSCSSECVALILPEGLAKLNPRLIIKNKKGKILAPDKSYTNILSIRQTTPIDYSGNFGNSTDEWRKYENSSKTSTYIPPAYVCGYDGMPRVLVYGLPHLSLDDVLNISIDANPVRTFEFTLPMPTDLLAH